MARDNFPITITGKSIDEVNWKVSYYKEKGYLPVSRLNYMVKEVRDGDWNVSHAEVIYWMTVYKGETDEQD